MILLDKKNFTLGEIQGTYTYKSNKNGTGVLKLNYKDGSGKYTVEISILALSEKRRKGKFSCAVFCRG